MTLGRKGVAAIQGDADNGHVQSPLGFRAAALRAGWLSHKQEGEPAMEGGY